MRLYRQTVRLAVPTVLEHLSTSIIFLVDALMVATLGPAALAAVGIVGIMMWRLRTMGGILQIGTTAMVARRWGENNTEAACRLFTHSALLGGIIGIGCLLLWPLAGWIFSTLNAEGDVLALSVLYFQVVILAFPLRLASTNMAAAIRAAGDTRTPMITTVVANMVNVSLNYTLIFGKFGFPELGLFGAAIATAIAFTTEFSIYLAMGLRGIRPRRLFPIERLDFIHPGEEDVEVSSEPVRAGVPDETRTDVLRFDPAGFRLRLRGSTGMMLRISHPSFWEEVGVSIGFLVFTAMLALFGEEALAAHSAVVRIESFSFMAGFGIAIATATLVGQALGARQVKTARRTFAICLTLSTMFMGSLGILFCLFPEWFVGWFVYGEENGTFMPLAAMLFILASLQQPFIGSAMVLSGGLRGAGHTMAPFVAQFFGTIGARLGGGYVLAFVFEMGVEGLYWATVLDWVLRTAILGGLLLTGRWERAKA